MSVSHFWIGGFMFLMGGCISQQSEPEADTNEEEEIVLPEETERKVLHEVFSGSTCGPCYDAENILLFT